MEEQATNPLLQTQDLTPNPLLQALRIPGETFRLPSQGLFYDDTVLDSSVKNGEVEIYPMTTIDEIIISTPDKLLSGKAITEIFSHCIPQIKNSAELLAKDVDFLMVCLRMVTFGQFMEVEYAHSCDNANKHTYTVDLQTIIRQAKSIDPTTLTQDYKVDMPNGQVVLLKPMTYGDVINLYQNTVTSKTDNLSDEESKKLVIDTLLSVVRSVNGITDKKHIHEWLEVISLGYKKKLNDSLSTLNSWGVDTTSVQICKDCGERLELRVSTNPVNFFI